MKYLDGPQPLKRFQLIQILQKHNKYLTGLQGEFIDEFIDPKKIELAEEIEGAKRVSLLLHDMIQNYFKNKKK